MSLRLTKWHLKRNIGPKPIPNTNMYNKEPNLIFETQPDPNLCSSHHFNIKNHVVFEHDWSYTSKSTPQWYNANQQLEAHIWRTSPIYWSDIADLFHMCCFFPLDPSL